MIKGNPFHMSRVLCMCTSTCFEYLVTTIITGTETQVERSPETDVQFWRNIACQFEKHAGSCINKAEHVKVYKVTNQINQVIHEK